MLFAFTNYSQNEKSINLNSTPGVWNISYNAGFSINYENATGHKISFEIGYSEDDKKAFLFNISTTKLYKTSYKSFTMYECSVGPRFYVLKNELVFLEGNIGAQINSENRIYPNWDFGYINSYYSSNTHSAFYFAAGLGTKVMISRNNAFLLRVKYNTTMPASEGFTYINAQFGLEFNTSKPEDEINQKNKRRLTFSLGGGINSPLDINGRKNTGEGIFLLECALPTDFNGEIYGEAAYNRINANNARINNQLISFNIGPRFFINNSLLSSFMEFGGGMYILAQSNYSKKDAVHPGLTIGTGLTGRINELFEIFAKGKIHFLFTDNPSFPPYSTLAGGVRFNL
jgi:hypothetical protein